MRGSDSDDLLRQRIETLERELANLRNQLLQLEGVLHTQPTDMLRLNRESWAAQVQFTNTLSLSGEQLAQQTRYRGP